MSDQTPILVVDDELQIRRLLQISLEAAGYKVHLAASGQEGLQQASMSRPEIVILDLGLPDAEGIDVLKKLREWATFPILILSVRSSEQDIVAALDAGADDYLTKPFRTAELLARIRTALRHRQPLEQEAVLHFGSVSVDLTARVVKKAGKIVKLTPTEYALLALFVRNAGRVLTHRFILQQIWGPTFEEESQYSRVYTGQLRKKLEDDPTHPRLVLTESGIGYRLSDEEQR
jgi:two-component system KDP operon response regulator KdpE